MARPIEEFVLAWGAFSGRSEDDGWRGIPVAPAGPCALMAGRRFPGNEEALLAGFSKAQVPAAAAAHWPVILANKKNKETAARDPQKAVKRFTPKAGEPGTIAENSPPRTVKSGYPGAWATPKVAATAVSSAESPHEISVLDPVQT